MLSRSVRLFGLAVCAGAMGGAVQAARAAGRADAACVRVAWVRAGRVSPAQRAGLKALLAAATDGALPRGVLVRDSRPEPLSPWVTPERPPSVRIARR
jgi:hypothetical protein